MTLKSRVVRLESVLQAAAFPSVVFSSVYLETEPTLDELKALIAEGKAEIGAGSHCIYHHGDERELTCEEWMAQFAPMQRVAAFSLRRYCLDDFPNELA
ncbi:hypothetical protein [Bradyrhizobium sp. 23AC]